MYGWNSLQVEVQFITSSSLSSVDGYTVWCEHFSVEQSVLIFRPFCRQYSTWYIQLSRIPFHAELTNGGNEF